MTAQFERVRGLLTGQLQELADGKREALDPLDRQAAQQALRLERAHAHHKDAAHEQAERADELEEQASGLGWRRRHEREQLLRNAAIQRGHASRYIADAERTELETSRLRAAGRHPDQWLEENAERVAAGIVASDELARRRQREIDDQIQRSLIEPPGHVLELIGDPPASGVRLVQQWERLAERIERHRLGHGIEVERDGALGPEPARIVSEQRHDYERQREQLASDIKKYREARRLPAHEQVREVTRAREQGLELEL